MGWIENRKDNPKSQTKVALPQDVKSRADRKWAELVAGFKQDVSEYNRLERKADFNQESGTHCRIVNSKSNVAVVVRADLSAENIHYIYEPEEENTPVPEGGMLALRTSDSVTELFSADQRLTTQQARRLILEPVLFAGEQLRKTDS